MGVVLGARPETTKHHRLRRLIRLELRRYARPPFSSGRLTDQGCGRETDRTGDRRGRGTKAARAHRPQFRERERATFLALVLDRRPKRGILGPCCGRTARQPTRRRALLFGDPGLAVAA